MGSSGLVKTLFVPASISLVIYLLIFYAIIPFVRRYRQRYSQYLPLHSISAHTSTLRDRAGDALMRLVLPGTWNRRRLLEGQEDGESFFDDDDGDSGCELDVAGREALDRRRSGIIESDTRLNRELEQGFMDDSDDEDTRERQS